MDNYLDHLQTLLKILRLLCTSIHVPWVHPLVPKNKLCFVKNLKLAVHRKLLWSLKIRKSPENVIEFIWLFHTCFHAALQIMSVYIISPSQIYNSCQREGSLTSFAFLFSQWNALNIRGLKSICSIKFLYVSGLLQTVNFKTYNSNILKKQYNNRVLLSAHQN